VPDEGHSSRVVELDLPARPEFVGIARLAVAALAGVRPGLVYERIDDLKIVVSEAFTGAVEHLAASGADARLRLRCHDGDDSLEVTIDGPPGVFGSVLSTGAPSSDNDLRITLISALVDEAEVRPGHDGSELRLVMKRLDESV
jgi:anti-sigma regulatory factor (Ser/Thr protein kinase)